MNFQNLFILLLFLLIFFGSIHAQNKSSYSPVNEPSLVILGTIQDAGSPHIACKKDCCTSLFENPDPLRKVISMGVIDPQANKTFLFEATPNITSQVKKLQKKASSNSELPDGIFITHAHIGHYTGLMYLGKEATNSKKIPVYTMPRMKTFLENNGPWNQLINMNNVSLVEMTHRKEIVLTPAIKVTPFLVPHRDEFSETVGYVIAGPKKKALFIPDIDKWQKWDSSIIEAISEVDYAFLDATFYDEKEINNRDISEIPHPFIVESMELFKSLKPSEKQKIYFIHFNHSNPVINVDSNAYESVIKNGFNIALMNMTFPL